MTSDIVPELLELINGQFDEELLKSDIVKKSIQLLQNKKATYKNANEFAIELGEILSKALGDNITFEKLPNGKFHFNMANRILNDTMKRNYTLISNYSSEVQYSLNKQSNLRIKKQIPKLNQSRIDGIVNRVSKEENFNKIKWILKEPIINFSQSVVDDVVKSNVEFHAKAGLKATITRIVVSDCCDWCRAVAGTYEYSSAPKDIYKRHRYCRCRVEYEPGDGRRQDSWTKKWIDPDKNDKIKIRKELSNDNNSISETRKRCFAENIEYNEIKKGSVKKLESEIIDYLGGGDNTKGSCSSLALAYIGNKNGYDVLDFRDGMSRKIFAEQRSIIEITELKGVKSFIKNEYNDFVGIKKLIKNMENGKEYFLATGEHASIIRKSEEMLEYLELQTEDDNGFKRLTSKVLKDRFGCKKSHSLYGTKYKASNVLIDIESLNGNEEFEKMLGFINTAKADQVKGVGGYAK